jgi:hypothetical protein
VIARFNHVVLPAFALALALVTVPAQADVTKAQCIKANVDGQNLRLDGKLADARVQLRLCSDPQCPAIVRRDCSSRLADLEAAQPTVVFEARDGAGNDLGAVTVTMDGLPLVDRLDGTPLDVAPGQHEFTFTVANQPPATRQLIIKEGEKGRRERIVIGTAPPVIVAAPVAPVAPDHAGLGPGKLAGIIVGGAGVAGVAVGAVFGLLTASAISAQKSDCPGNGVCPRYAQAASDHSTGTTDGTVSTAAFIAGGALIATGAVLFFTAHRQREPSATRGVVVAPSVGPGGGGMLLKGTF